jgi:hypothetical protein
MLSLIQDTYFGGAGRIRCARCTGKSKRTGLQCARPAIKGSKRQKCQFHGGRSTGPRTEAGKARIAAAHWKHGRETIAAKAERAKRSALLLQLEDAARVLGMITGGVTRGRRPKGYASIRTIDAVRELASDGFVADLRVPECNAED